MDNYVVINGKKAELTEEQLKALGIEVEKKRNNPFNTEPQITSVCSIGTVCVEYHGKVNSPLSSSMATMLVERANSFNDWKFANQVFLHELLNRKLLKYAWDNGWEDNQKWNGVIKHYYIVYDEVHKNFGVIFSYFKALNTVYFPSICTAKKAIEDVIKPFMEEHTEFWW